MVMGLFVVLASVIGTFFSSGAKKMRLRASFGFEKKDFTSAI
jgi:hypothetical protein